MPTFVVPGCEQMKIHTLQSMKCGATASRVVRSTAAVLTRFSLLLAVSAVRLVFAQPALAQEPAEYCQNSPTTLANQNGAVRTNSDSAEPSHRPEGQRNIIWSLGRPPERFRFPANSVIQFSVAAGDQGVCNLQLTQSTLQDFTTLFQLDSSRLHLCLDKDHCDAEINVPPDSTRRLEIRIDPKFHTPGIFTGEMAFAIKGKPETQSFKLIVYSRTRLAVVFGALVIASGLALYFLVNILLRRRIAIDEALLPAYQLRDTIESFERKVSEAAKLTQIPLNALTDALKQLENQLAPQILADHSPSITVLPSSSGTRWMDGFKAYLIPLADKTAALVVIVNSGVQTAIAYWTTFPVPAATALNQINLLAPSVNNAATAQALLAPILQTLYAAVNPPHAAMLAPMLAVAPSNLAVRVFTAPPDTHTLQLRLFHSTLWVWWIVALIALASGFYSVVLANLGFGTSTDYIKCFFWGLGFSVAGTQLDSLTQTTVTSNFGITIPKA
jgi:hypothetical protein